jgi:MFS family permease
MGLSTRAIRLIPTFDSIGIGAAFILFGLRMIQGLCLGGEYGGAITYVAEHVSDERRGYYTGWLQTSPTLGIVVSLAVIIACRTYFGNDALARDLRLLHDLAPPIHNANAREFQRDVDSCIVFHGCPPSQMPGADSTS